MNHTLTRIILISNVVELIAKYRMITIREARKLLYSSGLVKLIKNSETGLYGDSPLYIYSLFERMESNQNTLRNINE